MSDMVECFVLYEFMENVYLNYFMYVIMDRVLLFIGDGLKLVQCCIVYVMFELGLNVSVKFKKFVCIVGDVLGKYYLYGDIVCYEVMVLMVQLFFYCYLLVDGQGNWGVLDDFKFFVVMCYIEFCLLKYVELLFSELGQGMVDWVLNFDGMLQELKMLLVCLLNILLNGIIGIVVGMVIDIFLYNLWEVVKVVIMLIEQLKIIFDELLDIVQGLDFLIEVEIIILWVEICKIYQNGCGLVCMCVVWSKEDGVVVISVLLYQVFGVKVLEQIVVQMCNKKLLMVDDLCDELDYENLICLVIVLCFNWVDMEQVMNYLFVIIDLEKSYCINFNMIGFDGCLVVKNLLEIFSEWLVFCCDIVCCCLNYWLEKVLKCLYIFEGLLVVFFNIDEVIEIICIEDELKLVLMLCFGISEIQVEVILELKLCYFVKLEEMKICGEQSELEKECDQLQVILVFECKMNNLLKKELQVDVDVFGDDCCLLFYECEEVKVMSEYDMLLFELVIIVLLQMGWVCSVKGYDIDVQGLSYKVGDSWKVLVKGKSNQLVVFIDIIGCSYVIDLIILFFVCGQGELFIGKLILLLGVIVEYMLMESDDQKLLMVFDVGYGFVCIFNDLVVCNCVGKVLIILFDNVYVMLLLVIEDEFDMLLVIIVVGWMLMFLVSDLLQLLKGKGNKIISILVVEVVVGQDGLVYLFVLLLQSMLIIYVGKWKIKLCLEEL